MPVVGRRVVPWIVVLVVLVLPAVVPSPSTATSRSSAPGGAASPGSPASAAVTFAPGVGVPLDRITAMDDHGRIAGNRLGVGAVYDPTTGTTTEIGDLGGGSSAEAITNGGLVVGNTRLGPGTQDIPILFDLTTGTTTELGMFGFVAARVMDVTDSGLVLGIGSNPPEVNEGFVHDRTTGITTSLGAGFEPVAVDERGLVLGHEPARWVVVDVVSGARIDLEARIAGLLSAGALSDSGLVAGVAAGPDGGWQVFVHDLVAGTTDRIDFGAFLSGYSPTVAGVTDGGAVIGTGVGLDVVHGFVAVPEAGLIERVPPMPGDLTTAAEVLNDRGALAGRSCFWEDVTPALHCDEPFRSSVMLPPSPPRSLTAVGCTAPAVLAWEPPRFDGFAPLSGYDVVRDGAVIATLPPSATSFEDPAVTGTSTYSVVARNSQGASIPTTEVAWPAWPCRGGTVQGVVSAGGVPQPGIDVRVIDAADGRAVRKAVTDAGGRYRIALLPPGRYAVRFGDPTLRLLPEWFDDVPDRAAAQLLDVGLAREVVADADLAPAGRVEGRVVDRTGGLGGINVRIYDASTRALLAKTVTAPDGAFTVAGLRPGTIKVRFDDPTGWHQVQWFGGAATFGTAAGFPVVAGAVRRVDHELAEAGILAGTVSDAAGAPVADIPVRLYDPTTRIAFRKTVTDGSGGFQIGALAPGAVLVRFGDQITFPVEWYEDQPSPATADQVRIATGATTTVDATIER